MKQIPFLPVLLAGIGASMASPGLASSPAAVFRVFGEHGSGTAFLCGSPGLLLTESTPLTGARPPRIVLSPGSAVVGRVVLENSDRGIAVLWVSPDRLAGLEALPLSQARGEALGAVPGDSASIMRATLRGPETVSGLVRSSKGHRIEIDLPPRDGDAGSPVVNREGQVIGVVRSETTGAPPRCVALPIEDASPLLAAAAESVRTNSYPQSQVVPALPAEAFPPNDLRALGERPGRDLRDFQVVAGEYTISFLTPPTCYALTDRRDEQEGTWYLWGAFGADYLPVLAVHVQPRERSSSMFWPIGAIAHVGKGAAHVIGSVVGTVADRVIPGGSSGGETRSDHCEAQLLRDGAVIAPILCQCSGHVYEVKKGTFVRRKKSRAAFFYYPWQAFEEEGGKVPSIYLEVSDPGRTEDRDRIQITDKLLGMIAADFEPLRRGPLAEPR